MLKKLFCPLCLIGLALVILVIGGYFLLRGGYQASAPTSGISQESIEEKIALEETPEATTPEDKVSPPTLLEVKEITVIGAEMFFSPSTVTVQAGQQVKINFQNKGSTIHNLIIEGLGISTKTIRDGQTDVIEFTAPTSGTYAIFCSVPGHRAAGMKGSLIVE